MEVLKDSETIALYQFVDSSSKPSMRIYFNFHVFDRSIAEGGINTIKEELKNTADLCDY